MRIGKLQNSYGNFDIKKEEKNISQQTNKTTVTNKSVKIPIKTSIAYSGVNFGSRTYDGTNIRTDIKSRAEISHQKLTINGEETELELYKTKHSEYVLSADGTKLYKLRYVEDDGRITQQIIASKLYKSVGVRTPEYIAFEKDGKTGYLVEVFEEKLEPASTNKKALYKSFIADVWLGNRNGLSKDNTKIDKDGNPVKMSVSGSLGYRASGQPKASRLDYDIDEINTMRDFSINSDAARALSDMSDEDLYEAIRDFSNSYNRDTISTICGDYYTHTTLAHDLANVVAIRNWELERFENKDKFNKKIHAMGLDVKDNPELSNVRIYRDDLSDTQEISLEQWQKLKDRGLLRKQPWLKEMCLWDYKSLAKMTDEEHKNALERGLYSPMDINLWGYDILALSKLSNAKWQNVENRDLLHAHIKYGKGDFRVSEDIIGLANLEETDWNTLIRTDYLYSAPKINAVQKFLKFYNSDDAKKLEPPVDDRVRMMLRKQKELVTNSYSNIITKWNIAHSFEIDRGDIITEFASMNNQQWQKLVEITQNFTDIKMSYENLKELVVDFDQESYECLRTRGMLTKAKYTYGLADLATLSEEDWNNIEKREIDKLPHQGYSDWAYLASMSDEDYNLALEKGLFANRSKDNEYEFYIPGKCIAFIVESMNEKDWENAEKRKLLKGYTIYDMYSQEPLRDQSLVQLAKMSDNDFAKLEKINRGGLTRCYTKINLVTQLSDEEYKRLFARNLLKYIDTHESADDSSQDISIMKNLTGLSDEEFKKFEALSTSPYNKISSKCLVVKANKLGLDCKNNLSELTTKQKREYLQLLIEKPNDFFEKDFINNYKGGFLIPKTPDEYTEIIKKLVKSVGIDTTPISDTQKTNFLNTLENISTQNSEFVNLDLKNPNFRLKTNYSREKFISDVEELIKNMDTLEKNKIFDYFGFELYPAQTDNKTAMSGYPALINNNEKLATISNFQTKEIIKDIEPLVKRFTQENKIQPNEFITEKMANSLNTIFDVLPELKTTIGKAQHLTHDYTIDIHTLAVLQECIINPEFQNLNKEEKQTLIISTLLHDITKEEKEIDKSHPKTGAYDAYFILTKLGLPRTQQNNICQLIKNHDFLEQCNKKIFDYSINAKRPMSEDEQDKLVKQYAYELRSDNLGKIEQIITKSDLLSVKRNGEFYERYGFTLDKVGAKLDKEIQKIKSTSIPLPQTNIPKASKLKTDGINVVEKITQDETGNPIKNKVIYLKKGMDLSQYGFDKGVTTDNFNVVIHGFDTETQQSILDALELPNQNALLSSSYVVYSKGNYHAFRQQGFIKNVPADNIGVAYYRDFGSGYKKDTESLVNNYINGFMFSLRNYLPKLIKEELNLTDEQYADLYKQIKDKPMDILEKENPQVANALKDIFAKMEVHKRKFQRDYNEALIEKGETSAIYFVGKGKDEKAYRTEDIPVFLRKYAQDNDLPIIYFGE